MANSTTVDNQHVDLLHSSTVPLPSSSPSNPRSRLLVDAANGVEQVRHAEPTQLTCQVRLFGGQPHSGYRNPCQEVDDVCGAPYGPLESKKGPVLIYAKPDLRQPTSNEVRHSSADVPSDTNFAGSVCRSEKAQLGLTNSKHAERNVCVTKIRPANISARTAFWESRITEDKRRTNIRH